MTDALLSARDLAWAPEGKTVVGPIDLDIAAGECWAVIGPNGAGKTSLLRLLAGVLTPTRGEVRHRGARLEGARRREVARRIAYVPQLRPLSVSLTVDEVVLSGRYPFLGAWQWAPAAADREAIERALDLVGLTALRDRPVDRLSGGERQAVYVAAALAQEAEILILDEPTTHLDPGHQRDVLHLLARLRDDGRHALVVATHDLAFGSILSDHALALSAGLVFAQGGAAEIFRAEPLERLFGAPFATLSLPAGADSRAALVPVLAWQERRR